MGVRIKAELFCDCCGEVRKPEHTGGNLHIFELEKIGLLPEPVHKGIYPIKGAMDLERKLSKLRFLVDFGPYCDGCGDKIVRVSKQELTLGRMKKLYQKFYLEEGYLEYGIPSFLREVVGGFDMEEREEWDAFVRELKEKDEFKEKIGKEIKEKTTAASNVFVLLYLSTSIPHGIAKIVLKMDSNKRINPQSILESPITSLTYTTQNGLEIPFAMNPIPTNSPSALMLRGMFLTSSFIPE